MNKKPELLAPAGSFMSAYYAFMAGADAVYLGLTRYSARMTAQNFNYNELLRLKKIADALNKKIYITINTVIQEDELNDLILSLQFIENIDINAVIVQDIGLIELLRNYYPDLPIHASTQMAIHNKPGIEKAIELGICRIILPREMSYQKIKAFKKKYPNIPFEIFIHGALCYSYSGLCLASGLLYNQSSNRGKCRQPCRNSYELNGEKNNYFSCKDLSLGRLINRLIKIGVDSFKIEGRQKNPEYVYNVVKFYRYLIDHYGNIKGNDYQTLLKNSEFVFSREKTTGYAFKKRTNPIITESYARHIGASIGFVKALTHETFSFKTTSALTINDVLLFFLTPDEKIPYKMPLRKMLVNDQSVLSVNPHTLVKIYSDKIPAAGQEIFKAYAKSLELEGISNRQFKPYRKLLPVEITLLKKENYVLQIGFIMNNRCYSKEFFLILGKSGTPIDLQTRLQEILSRPSDIWYEIKISKFTNTTSIDTREISILNAVLKGIHRLIYQFIQQIENEIILAKISLILNRQKNENLFFPSAIGHFNGAGLYDFIKKRANLNLKNSKIPFFTGQKAELSSLAVWENYYFIPLMPIVDDDEWYYQTIRYFIKKNPDKFIFLGINNLHHFKVIESLINDFSYVFSFIDFFMYAANRFTLLNQSVVKTRVMFAYYWIEGSEEGFQALKATSPISLIRIEPDFNAPLFIHAKFCQDDCLKPNKKYPANSQSPKISHNDCNFCVIEKKQFNYIFKE